MYGTTRKGGIHLGGTACRISLAGAAVRFRFDQAARGSHRCAFAGFGGNDLGRRVRNGCDSCDERIRSASALDPDGLFLGRGVRWWAGCRLRMANCTPLRRVVARQKRMGARLWRWMPCCRRRCRCWQVSPEQRNAGDRSGAERQAFCCCFRREVERAAGFLCGERLRGDHDGSSQRSQQRPGPGSCAGRNRDQLTAVYGGAVASLYSVSS